MNKPEPRKPSAPTGPLNIGTFTYRDGVWYLRPVTVKK